LEYQNIPVLQCLAENLQQYKGNLHFRTDRKPPRSVAVTPGQKYVCACNLSRRNMGIYKGILYHSTYIDR